MIPDLPPVTFAEQQEAGGSDALTAALSWHDAMFDTAKQTEAAEAAALEREAAARRAARSVERQPAATGMGTPSGDLPALLLTIRANESGGNYGAVNASGCEGYGCYGAYQLHGLYSDDWARRYGAAAYASTPANQWAPGIQDRVALGLFYSTNPPGMHWCSWTDYC